MPRNENIADILTRFCMGFADLKSSPDYEQELILDVGSKELSQEDFAELVELMPKREVTPSYRENGAMVLTNLTTGVTHSAHVWSKIFSKGIYKKIRECGSEFTFKGNSFVIKGA